MGRAAYQRVDDLRIGHKPCGRVGAIQDSLVTLGCPRPMVMSYAKDIAAAYPDCRRVVKALAVEGRKCFHYRDGQGNLCHGELK